MSSASSGQGEGVYCHQCDHDWLRQDHGLVCPRCQSDFVEIIERNSQDDPRDDRFSIDGLGADIGTIPFSWPDPPSPDVQSVSSRGPDSPFTWGTSAPGSATFSNSTTSNDYSSSPRNSTSPPPSSSATGAIGGILGFISNALGGQTQQMSADHGPAGGTRTTTWRSPSGNAHFSMTMSTSTYGPGDNNPRMMTPLTPTDLNSFMNNLFTAPLSPGGTRHPMGFGPAGNDSTTLLDILLGGRLGNPGQYAHSQEDFDRIISDIMERTQAGSGAPAATEDEIAHLPKKKVDAKMLGESGEAECTICMAAVAEEEVVTELYCKHWFHTDCIKAWLEQHNTCPHCRMSVEEAKQTFDRQQREMADQAQPNSGDNEAERKRKRGSISSLLGNGRSAASRAANTARMPGAFPTSSFPALDTSYESASAQPDSGAASPRMSRLRSNFLARNPNSTHLQPPQRSPPRRSSSGDTRTLYAARNDHWNQRGHVRRSSRSMHRESPYDRRERHASYDAYASPRSSHQQHRAYERHESDRHEHTGLFARARGWLSGR